MSEGRRTRSTKAKTEVNHELPTTRSTRKARKQIHEEAESDNILIETTCKNKGRNDESLAEMIDKFKSENEISNYSSEDNITFGCESNIKEENNDVIKQETSSEENVSNIAKDVTKQETEEKLSDSDIYALPNSGDENSCIHSKELTEKKEIQDSLNEDCEMAENISTGTKTEDTMAHHEDLNVKDDQATDLDEIENISEDELPAPTKLKVQDAEEVSDEELPGPKMAELPADTEVVSEEELPSTMTALNNNKKDGKRKLEDYDPSNPTEENDSPEKKVKKDDEEKVPKIYKLPELEKYWKAVKSDSDDFNAWTYLLQYVDSENDVEAAREAYDCFLSRYCYCYGYWRKYADYEKKKGSLEKCNEVFERGLNAIPLSVDLWIHYLTHVKQMHQEDRSYIRTQFERALDACGLEFRSDKLWEGYIRWEMEEKNLLHVVSIYDRLLATPTQGYKTHMENFRELVNNNPVQKLIPIEEFKKYRDEVRKDNYEKADDEAPPGLDEADDHVRNDEEADAIKKLIINKRKKVNKANVEIINKRWSFEEGIKRPYFHVKQLEKIQLKNWNDYLDFEIEHGDQKRILVLFERCLIACALYEEFWLKLIHYWEKNQDDPNYENQARNAFTRACCIHHQDKPNLHLLWSAFEEFHGNVDKAADILANLEKKIPNVLQIAYRRINLERRRGQFEQCAKLYEHYLDNVKNKNLSSSLAIKYARFLNKIMHNYDKAMNILRNALDKDTTNTRLALQIIDLSLQRENVDEIEIVKILDKFTYQENLDVDQRVLFAQRKVEFLEDFGSSIKHIQDAQKVLQVLLDKSKEAKKKTSDHSDISSLSNKKTKDSNSSSNNIPYSSGYNYQSSYTNSYPVTNQWTGGSYNYDYNQWSGSYYNSSSYGNYQHGSYGSSY